MWLTVDFVGQIFNNSDGFLLKNSHILDIFTLSCSCHGSKAQAVCEECVVFYDVLSVLYAYDVDGFE